MARKFIPNGDEDFSVMAGNFARRLAAEPKRFDLSREDVDALSTAVEAYQAALARARGAGRSPAATIGKETARAAAEKIVRRLGHLLRANPRLDAEARTLLGIRARAAKARILPCPPEPPRLRFVRALHEGNGATPVHELAFAAGGPNGTWAPKRPPGAVRLELFVDLIPPDAPIPAHPGASSASRPWYLRSYTRSPIRLTPPMARLPMRVVYWGRWADSLGNVGPFGATAVAWVEGGSHRMLPGGVDQAVPMIEDGAAAEGGDESYRVAILEVRYAALGGRQVVGDLHAPERREPRQLEGPPAAASREDAA